MNIYFIIIYIISFIEIIKSDSSSNNDSYFWKDNIWLIILLIIISVGLIILIVFISIKIFKNCRRNKKPNNENISVNTERSSQKLVSDYDKNGRNNKKIKYKERPMEEIKEDE